MRNAPADSGISLKFGRSKYLAAQLNQAVGAWISSPEHIELTTVTEQDTGNLVMYARLLEQPPLDWSALIGDAIHNARAALDHLAVLIVEQHGKGNGRRQFPITDKATRHGNELRSALPGVPPEIRDRFRALQPYADGDRDLWLLHTLDIYDKHRLILPVVAANAGVSVSIQISGFNGEPPRLWQDAFHIGAAHPETLSDQPVEVFRDAISPELRAENPFDKQEPTFTAVFDEGTPAAGESATDSVQRLVDHAAAVGQSLRDLITP